MFLQTFKTAFDGKFMKNFVLNKKKKKKKLYNTKKQK